MLFSWRSEGKRGEPFGETNKQHLMGEDGLPSERTDGARASVYRMVMGYYYPMGTRYCKMEKIKM